jgi:hypothetical protein
MKLARIFLKGRMDRGSEAERWNTVRRRPGEMQGRRLGTELARIFLGRKEGGLRDRVCDRE